MYTTSPPFRSLGCLDLQCVLCEHNPSRRCSVNFASKYLVNDTLLAKCDAPIRVEVIDRTTGIPIHENIPGVSLELCILDGNAYEMLHSEHPGEDIGNDVDSCTLLLNNKAEINARNSIGVNAVAYGNIIIIKLFFKYKNI